MLQGVWENISDLEMRAGPNERWLKGEIVNNSAIRVWCGVCYKHIERLRCVRNFSEAFVTSISGSAIKRDPLMKCMYISTKVWTCWSSPRGHGLHAHTANY